MVVSEVISERAVVTLWLRQSSVVLELPPEGPARARTLGLFRAWAKEGLFVAHVSPRPSWRNYAKHYQGGELTTVYAHRFGQVVSYWWEGEVGPRRAWSLDEAGDGQEKTE